MFLPPSENGIPLLAGEFKNEYLDNCKYAIYKAILKMKAIEMSLHCLFFLNNLIDNLMFVAYIFHNNLISNLMFGASLGASSSYMKIIFRAYLALLNSIQRRMTGEMRKENDVTQAGCELVLNSPRSNYMLCTLGVGRSHYSHSNCISGHSDMRVGAPPEG